MIHGEPLTHLNLAIESLRRIQPQNDNLYLLGLIQDDLMMDLLLAVRPNRLQTDSNPDSYLDSYLPEPCRDQRTLSGGPKP